MIKMQEILDLSIAERILMIEKIWDSIDRTHIQLPVEHELERRLTRHEKGETTFVSWSEIKAELNGAK